MKVKNNAECGITFPADHAYPLLRLLYTFFVHFAKNMHFKGLQSTGDYSPAEEIP